MDLETSAKEISIFESYLTVQWRHVHLTFMEVINLHYNDVLKGKYQEKNLMDFYKCLPSNKYAQLKAHAYGFRSVLPAPICERHFFKLKYS